MRYNQTSRCLPVLCLLVAFSDKAHADGGIVRARESQGPFTVTVFTPSNLVQDDPADISVLVQRSDSKEAILDATVELTFNPPSGSRDESREEFCGPTVSESKSFKVQASRDLAMNKLFYAAPVRFGAPGNWTLAAVVKHGTEAVDFSCVIPVEPTSRGFGNLFPYLLLPPFFVALFLTNQFLIHRHRHVTGPPECVTSRA